MAVSRLEIPFRRVRARLVAGGPTGGGLTSSRRPEMTRTAEDGRALLKAAQEIHAERHGAQTFPPGTHLPLEAAGERIGISPSAYATTMPFRTWSTRGPSSETRVRAVRQGGQALRHHPA